MKTNTRKESFALIAVVGLLISCLSVLFTARARAHSSSPTNSGSAGPAVTFTWSMRERFGAKNKDDIVDYHWDPVKQEYDDAYVHPRSWTVDFNACNAVPAQSALRWEVDGQALADTTCSFSHEFPALRSYATKLTATSPEGQISVASEDINLRDIFIVSIGDSFGAGQGTPEKTKREGLRWIDKPCHRSSWAGPARAAIIAEKADPHSSITFISFSCTGAGLQNGFLEEQIQGGRRNKRQLAQVFAAAGDRPIDALLVSIGGNDVSFAELVLKAVLLRHAETNSGVKRQFEEGLATLPERFALMAQKLQDPQNKARIANVFISEYPDLVRDETRDFCDHSGHVLDALHGISGDESEWALNSVIIPLNAKIREQADRWGWNYVGGIVEGFGGGSADGIAHGFCADDKRWVNTFSDSLKFQGDLSGTIHPNKDGYLWYAQRLVAEMRAKGVTGQ